ncbi:cytochrome P450 [Hymenopellis radicata]|nr:cytochrome P450 [Hymenopellis radicata]
MIFSVLYIDYILFLAAFYFLWRILNRPSLSLPPGPRGYPIIGNVLDMPQSKPWEMFGQWGDRWGDINSVTVFGKPFIILNSYRTAYALLDKRSLIYSDRPKLVMAGQMMGWGEIIGLLPYGEEFRSHRKMFHSLFGSKATIRRFYPMEELEAKNFMRRLFDTRTIGLLIFARKSPPWCSASQLSVASTPGAFLVDFIPMLKSLPDWFPGAGFKRTAKMWAKDLEDMINVPFEHVKAEMARGQALDSFVSGILQQGDSVSEHDLKWTAGAIYAAGGDTTVAALDAFFLLMVLNPEVQKKAQEELDLVLGGDRLPTYNDMDDLPYITALCKEVVRFHPVAPIGIPHFTTEDDIFEGHYIPKGSMVISNIWKMTHDPNVYKNPMQFDPTRFMGENPEQDPREVSFGFGRRVCPGRLLAQSTIFIVCAMALSLFDIRKVKGEEPTFSIEHGSVSHPTPYNCTFTPRSSRAVELLHSA